MQDNRPTARPAVDNVAVEARMQRAIGEGEKKCSNVAWALDAPIPNMDAHNVARL